MTDAKGATAADWFHFEFVLGLGGECRYNGYEWCEACAARCRCCSAKDIRIVYAAAALVGYEVDHIVALANGGKHCCKNLQLLTLAAHKEKTKQDRRAHWKP